MMWRSLRGRPPLLSRRCTSCAVSRSSSRGGMNPSTLKSFCQLREASQVDLSKEHLQDPWIYSATRCPLWRGVTTGELARTRKGALGQQWPEGGVGAHARGVAFGRRLPPTSSEWPTMT